MTTASWLLPLLRNLPLSEKIRPRVRANLRLSSPSHAVRRICRIAHMYPVAAERTPRAEDAMLGQGGDANVPPPDGPAACFACCARVVGRYRPCWQGCFA